MRQADSLFRRGQYRDAFYKYNMARTFSPSKRTEVDDKINQLFKEVEDQRINAEDNERKVKETNRELKESRERERVMDSVEHKRQSIEHERLTRDSVNFAETFINNNRELLDTRLSRDERQKLLTQVDSLRRIGFGSLANYVAASVRSLHEARQNNDSFVHYLKNNSKIVENPHLFSSSQPIEDIGYIAYDTYYYWALAKLGQAINLMPDILRKRFEPSVLLIADSMKVGRKFLEENYWMADTVIDLPYRSQTLFTSASADNQNFMWGSVAAYELQEYKFLPLRFVDLSADNFRFATDSVIELPLNGKYYTVLASDANYRFMVVRQIDYSLKKNLVAFKSRSQSTPDVVKLVDRNGNKLTDLYDGAFFFSPDARFLANWRAGTDELNLYDLKARANCQFPFKTPVKTMSLSSDSKTMVYYNDSTSLFYYLDLTGNKPKQVSSFSLTVAGIGNIDFTGSDKFLKINTRDSIFLYDLYDKRMLFGFSSNLVANIVVAPNGKEALLTCNRKFNTQTGHFTYCVDMNLKIKDKMYSDCENFFYTPDGKFIVGYDQYDVMRWRTEKSELTKNEFKTCLGFKELIDKGCVPFNYFLAINDAIQLEQAARRLYDTASAYVQKKDTLVGNLYLRQSQLLFDRLKIGDAQNLRQDRVPFYYDWSNFIRRALNNRDFYNQFSTQQLEIGIFDTLIASRNGNYPMALYYAANANMFLNNLYDSLNIFNPNYLAQLKKEIDIRERVFEKNPDDTLNVYYAQIAFLKFSPVSDTLGFRYLRNRQYTDRLNLFRTAEQYLASKLKSLPDSFGVKSIYIEALSQLAPSYLYTFASGNGKDQKALDSVIYFADKGISLTSNKYYIATFLVAKARAFLFQENGIDKALDLYGKVINEYPEFNKRTMLLQLNMMKEAGANASTLSRVEEFLNKN